LGGDPVGMAGRRLPLAKRPEERHFPLLPKVLDRMGEPPGLPRMIFGHFLAAERQGGPKSKA